MLNRNDRSHLAPLFALALLTSGMLAGCEGCNHEATDGSENATMDQAGGANGGAAGTTDANGSTGGSTDRSASGDTSTMDSRSSATGAATGTPATPAEERTSTVTNMQGMRAILMTELDAVRGRLKQAGRPDETVKADQTRAGELAQGLERLDRLIKKTTEADDVSWATVRESTMNEAAEFRTWMAKYGMNAPS